MGITEIVALITGLLQFPKTILEFIQVLRKTPQEKHSELLKKIAEEARKFEETGRPTW